MEKHPDLKKTSDTLESVQTPYPEEGRS